MEENLFQKIQQKINNQKIIEVKTDEKSFTIEFLKTPILVVGFDDDYHIDSIIVKNVPGLNENISYFLLELIEDFPDMGSEEFDKLPTKMKSIHYAVNFAGILLNNNSLANQNILLSKTEHTMTLLLNSLKDTVVMSKTPQGMVYSILTEDNYQNNNFIMTIELIKEMLYKGLELGILNNSFKEFMNNITLLQDKLYQDSKKKILKNITVNLTKVAIMFTLIFLLLHYFNVHIPMEHLEP